MRLKVKGEQTYFRIDYIWMPINYTDDTNIRLKMGNQVWQQLVTTKTSSLHIPLSQTGRQHCFQRLNEVLTVCNQSISSMQDHGLRQL